MKFIDIWTPAAEQDLAAVWLGALDRNAVTAAAHAIEILLREDADTVGQPLFDTVRTVIVPPLGVDFDVDMTTSTVYVLSAWDAHFGRPVPGGN